MKTSRKDFTKNCLATAFIELLEDHEISDISIQDIVDKAGFSRMAYYRNFNSLDEILDYYLFSYSEAFVEKTKINFATMGAEKFFITIFEHLGDEKTRHIADIMYERGLIFTLYRSFLQIFNPKDKDAKRLYDHRFIAGGVFGVYIRWAKLGYKETPEELTQIVMRFLPEEMKTKR